MSFMEAVHDLIEEAKLRTLYWTICIFVLCYFISHTSKSMWMNIPISLLLVSALRILSSKVEFRWRVQLVGRPTYLSHLEKKQLSVNDSRLSTSPPPPKWMRKISSPVVEAAVHEFINKLLQDFVVDLWYSDITPDREAPELMRSIIMDVLGEISGRVKELNLVDLLTRDVVDLIGDHLDLYRRNQLAIGRDVMNRLSIEERDERLKHHLMDSKELHPALISPECEYKVLQQLIGGVLSVVLRPREAQCPLARCIARELVASLVLQPVMNLACPAYINELIESLFLAAKGGGPKVPSNVQSDAVGHQHDYSAAEGVQNGESTLRTHASSDIQGIEKVFSKANSDTKQPMDATGTLIPHAFHSNSLQQHSADWARGLNAATQRRTEVLMPENLENMWSRGRNYKKSAHKSVKAEVQARSKRGYVINSSTPTPISGEYMLMNRPQNLAGMEEKSVVRLTLSSEDLNRELPFESTAALIASGSKPRLRRSNSTSSLKVYPSVDIAFSGEGEGSIISEFYDPNVRIDKENGVKGTSDMVLLSEALHAPKLKCGVRGAYFEKIGSKSFAVYSIVVTDAENNTWSVKRRYRNFERLHRQLKDIPNYTLHLPPKRIFSSSTEDSFVHQRCIQLNRYLQDLLSIANVAEQHEVWDFFSASSKNYSFGKSSSVMKTLAVNVDDAVDDIVRQFKEVSDGLVRKVVGSSHFEASSSMSGRNMSWHSDDIRKHILGQSTTDAANSFSDNGEGGNAKNHGLGEFGYSAEANGWHSDNELNSRSFPPRVIKSNEVKSIDLKKSRGMDLESELFGPSKYPSARFPNFFDQLEDPIGVPPEWTPPNVSVPILNLVDKLFQLKRRGWLRRQVFWISKQILQLVMEDAIDDFLLRQISWLRREEIIAQGVRWVQDVLWPNGTFFLRLVNAQTGMDGGQHIQGTSQATGSAVKQGSSLGSFEAQLEASRRASDIKKIIFDGAPTTLVSLIGSKQYKRCANDIYYFLQSTVCVKQLAYGILELALISVFPELRELLIDVHKKTRAHL